MAIRVIVLMNALLLFCGEAALAKDWHAVNIALEGQYAPWNMKNADGSLIGFEPELADYLCKRMKVKCNLVAAPWDGMIPALNSGKFDAIMDALSITAERQKIIDFSEPYAITPASFAAAKTSLTPEIKQTSATITLAGDEVSVPEVDHLKKLFAGKKIGIQAGTVYAKFVYDNFGDASEILEYNSSADRDTDLEKGVIDLGFDDWVYFGETFEKSTSLTFVGPKIAGTIWGAGEGVGLRKEDSDLRDMFNEAIQAARADGTIRRLSLKWFKTDVSPAN